MSVPPYDGLCLLFFSCFFFIIMGLFGLYIFSWEILKVFMLNSSGIKHLKWRTVCVGVMEVFYTNAVFLFSFTMYKEIQTTDWISSSNTVVVFKYNGSACCGNVRS